MSDTNARQILFNQLERYMKEAYEHGGAVGLKTKPTRDNYRENIQSMLSLTANNMLLYRINEDDKYDRMWNRFLDYLETKLPSFFQQMSDALSRVEQVVTETRQVAAETRE